LTQITIEYMIMIPLLILQIFLFPYATSLIMNNWTDSRRTLELQETASNLGSSIQQLYSSLNHTTIKAGTVTHTLDLPPFIENYAYTGKGVLRAVSDSGYNSSKILEITLTLNNTQVMSTTTVSLGEGVSWVNSTFVSNSANSGISAHKFANDTVQLSFIS
jgi:hypothetical protein